MTRISRRVFLQSTVQSAAAASLLGAGNGLLPNRARAEEKGSRRKFTMNLSCGSIGVRADQLEAIRLADRFGFGSVDPSAGFLGRLSDDALAALLADMKAKNLVWGSAGLPVNFRGDAAAFREGMKQLPETAKTLRRAGVTRMGTWLTPCSRTMPYADNFRQHAQRLGEASKVLADCGLRFGMEYVGPKNSWTAAKYPFIHTLAQTKELIAAMGQHSNSQGNAGVVLDSWHWYNARETVDDLLALKNKDVVSCDLNDAPAGLPIDQQVDSRRELPCATGVIDLKAFLGALVKIGYDGPIRAEPFNAALRSMRPEEAVEATADAMKKAFGLIG